MKLRRDAKIELLRRVPLFAGCSGRQLAQISALADELYQPQGATLITEGTKGREFFVLVDGSVDVRRRGRRLNGLGSGTFFGEIALVSDTPRTATVVATSPVRLLVITGQSFSRLLRETPSIQAKVLAALAERVAPSTV
jgi:CRP/FNR family cyclic AMP-dependent transcriptional regulator